MQFKLSKLVLCNCVIGTVTTYYASVFALVAVNERCYAAESDIQSTAITELLSIPSQVH